MRKRTRARETTWVRGKRKECACSTKCVLPRGERSSEPLAAGFQLVLWSLLRHILTQTHVHIPKDTCPSVTYHLEIENKIFIFLFQRSTILSHFSMREQLIKMQVFVFPVETWIFFRRMRNRSSLFFVYKKCSIWEKKFVPKVQTVKKNFLESCNQCTGVEGLFIIENMLRLVMR